MNIKDMSVEEFFSSLDSLAETSRVAYTAAASAAGYSHKWESLPFSSRIQERKLVNAILENPSLTVRDFYLIRADHETATGLLSDIQHSTLGLENTNPSTQTFIRTFYDTVRSRSATHA